MDGGVARTTLLAFATIALVVAPPPSVAAPVPSPTPSPATGGGTALREIGHVRVTSPLCKALVTGAVRAVEIETDNDRRLSVVETTLQTVDLDGNQILKHRGVADLSAQYVALRASAVEGNGVMREFRERAKTATNVEQRANLIAFADALDGALHRQKVLADDVGRLIAYLDAHEPIDKDTHDKMVFNAILRQNDGRFPHTAFDVRDFGPTAGVPDPLSVTAKAAGEELVRRGLPIGGDEDAAAARIDPAFAAC